ncbi:MAG: type II toxin-antitoxin system HicB family antitoxin [Puia sp.]|nr:type II toxin-antitoxin system HicB family antitoxin [Puia sp.]
MNPNIMTIDGQKAVICYDSEIEMLRGEFLHLSGGADFYASNIDDLKKEGKTSLKIYLEACKDAGIDPFKKEAVSFNFRWEPDIRTALIEVAATRKKSVNKVLNEILREVFH